jgi:hypothetical protein
MTQVYVQVEVFRETRVGMELTSGPVSSGLTVSPLGCRRRTTDRVTDEGY